MSSFQTTDKYLATQQVRLLQEQAEVDPLLAEAVVAYARLCTDRGAPLEYYREDITLEEVRAQNTFIHTDFIVRNTVGDGEGHPTLHSEPHPESLDPRLLDFFCRYGEELARRNLPIIYSVDHLVAKLGCTFKQLVWLSSPDNARRYRSKTIAKSDGSARSLHVPVGELKKAQQWIARRILAKFKPHRYASAFVPGRSIVDAAGVHQGRRVIVRLDLKDFFPSISYTRVRRLFTSMGYPYSVARTLANLTCCDGGLPQGAPTSPALSNLAALRLDRRLVGLKKHHRFYYSRYADDILLSSDDADFPRMVPLFKDIIAQEGFTPHEGKIKIMRRGKRQQALGLRLSPAAPSTSTPSNPSKALNPTNISPRTLRAALHNIARHGWEREAMRWSEKTGQPLRDITHFAQVLRGQLAFLHMVNPPKGAPLIARWESLALPPI